MKLQPTVIDAMDKAEVALSQHPNHVHIEPVHKFTNGMYIREITIPAGCTFVTEIHKTEHPYTIAHGCLSIWTGSETPEFVETGHIGVTTPGTRRFVHAHTESVWRTFHPNPTNTRDINELHDMIIEKHTNPHMVELALEGEGL